MTKQNLVNLLLKINISKYLEWKVVENTFIYQWEKLLLGKSRSITIKCQLIQMRLWKIFLRKIVVDIKDKNTYVNYNPKGLFKYW